MKNRAELLALAVRVEAADPWRCERVTEEFLSVFGHEQRRIQWGRGEAWKRSYPAGYGPWQAPLSPLRSLDDLVIVLREAGCLPAMLASDARLAAAASLRALAAADGGEGVSGTEISDEVLAETCCPGESDDDKARFLACLSDEHRATLKRLIRVGDELNAGRIPPEVMV